MVKEQKTADQLDKVPWTKKAWGWFMKICLALFALRVLVPKEWQDAAKAYVLK